jgi:aspartate kinase
MLELASLGAKVLQTRSVELAMVYGVNLRVRSTFEPADAPVNEDEGPGTLVCDEEDIVEQQVVSGITYSKDEAQISLRKVRDKPGVSAAIFGPLAESEISVDMIVQNVSSDGEYANLTFTLATKDLDRALGVLESSRDRIGYEELTHATGVAKVSVIGVGMRSHAGVAAQMFEALAEKGINIQLITTSEIKISVLIDAAYTELAVRVLHSAYQLDKN